MALLLVVPACGGATGPPGVDQPGTGRPGAGRPPGDRPADDPPSWASYAAQIVSVRPGGDDRSLVLGLDVPAGAPDCARNPHVVSLEEERGQLFVNVVIDSARSHVQGACPGRETLTWTLTVPTPVTGKAVMFNTDDLWAPDDGGYRRCDDQLGCHPPADHCSPVWLDAVVSRMDVPRHSFRDTRHCDQRWLVMDINVNAGQCGAGPRPGCSVPPSVTRWFLRFDNGWRELTGSRRPGCADVREVEPRFPTRICAKLPPVS